MKKRLVKSEELIIRNVPIEISDAAELNRREKAELERRKRQQPPRLSVEKDDNNNITGVEVTCSCGEVIKLALRYDEADNQPS